MEEVRKELSAALSVPLEVRECAASSGKDMLTPAPETDDAPAPHPHPASPPKRVVARSRFRTPHGSHTVAFFGQVPALTLPWEVALDLPKLSPAEAKALKDTVRAEAAEEIALLARLPALAGQASSHFSVFARLLGGAAAPDVFFGGWAEVASGRLANGFFHGQLNTTFALHRPEERMRAVLARLLDWPAGPADGPVALDAAALLPSVPWELLQRLAPGWRGEADAARHCTEALADPVAMVNDGADFYAHKNWELAWACWLRAAQHAQARGPVSL